MVHYVHLQLKTGEWQHHQIKTDRERAISYATGLAGRYEAVVAKVADEMGQVVWSEPADA